MTIYVSYFVKSLLCLCYEVFKHHLNATHKVICYSLIYQYNCETSLEQHAARVLRGLFICEFDILLVYLVKDDIFIVKNELYIRKFRVRGQH